MIEWYIDIDKWAPNQFKTDKFKEVVTENTKPVMAYISEKLKESDYNLSEFYQKFKDAVDDLPIMNVKSNIDDEIIIQYNRWVDIKLVDSTKAIYRDIKLNKLLN
jgi:hypothetical protein